MTTVRNCLLVGALLLWARPAAAQHEGHTVPPTQPPAATAEQVTACVQSQRQVMALVDAGNRRLELARQANEPSSMRSAIEDFQATLSAVRSQLATCAQLAAAAPIGDARAGHVMPGAANVQQSPAARPGTPVMQPGAPQPAPGAVNRDAAAGAPTPADPHAAHTMSAAQQADLVKDPRCRENVDPKSAPQATYDGRTYYFCSERDRQLFVADPAKHLQQSESPPERGATGPRPRGGTADPHAGHAMPAMPPAQRAQPDRAGTLDIVFRSTPSPPRGASENRFEVTVKDPHGKPVDDAEVSIMFYMPPMPAMKMPETRNDVKLTGAGNGRYMGSGQLAMAGQWTVTVSVKRDGKQIGQRKLTITAK